MLSMWKEEEREEDVSSVDLRKNETWIIYIRRFEKEKDYMYIKKLKS